MKCVFCELPEIKERPIVAEEHAWAFPTNIPITPGHTLVVPQRCIRTTEELTDEEVLALLKLVYRIQDALRDAFGAEGFNVAWNDGAMAGQTVPHLHIHIVPRKEGDTGIYEYEPRKFLYRPGGDRPESPEEELQEVAAQIREPLT